ncbi:MAG: hypothetical protein ABIE84_00005 [bacterium]
MGLFVSGLPRIAMAPHDESKMRSSAPARQNVFVQPDWLSAPQNNALVITLRKRWAELSTLLLKLEYISSRGEDYVAGVSFLGVRLTATSAIRVIDQLKIKDLTNLLRSNSSEMSNVLQGGMAIRPLIFFLTRIAEVIRGKDIAQILADLDRPADLLVASPVPVTRETLVAAQLAQARETVGDGAPDWLLLDSANHDLVAKVVEHRTVLSGLQLELEYSGRGARRQLSGTRVLTCEVVAWKGNLAIAEGGFNSVGDLLDTKEQFNYMARKSLTAFLRGLVKLIESGELVRLKKVKTVIKKAPSWWPLDPNHVALAKKVVKLRDQLASIPVEVVVSRNIPVRINVLWRTMANRRTVRFVADNNISRVGELLDYDRPLKGLVANEIISTLEYLVELAGETDLSVLSRLKAEVLPKAPQWLPDEPRYFPLAVAVADKLDSIIALPFERIESDGVLVQVRIGRVTVNEGRVLDAFRRNEIKDTRSFIELSANELNDSHRTWNIILFARLLQNLADYVILHEEEAAIEETGYTRRCHILPLQTLIERQPRLRPEFEPQTAAKKLGLPWRSVRRAFFRDELGSWRLDPSVVFQVYKTRLAAGKLNLGKLGVRDETVVHDPETLTRIGTAKVCELAVATKIEISLPILPDELEQPGEIMRLVDFANGLREVYGLNQHFVARFMGFVASKWVSDRVETPLPQARGRMLNLGGLINWLLRKTGVAEETGKTGTPDHRAIAARFMEQVLHAFVERGLLRDAEVELFSSDMTLEFEGRHHFERPFILPHEVTPDLL